MEDQQPDVILVAEVLLELTRELSRENSTEVPGEDQGVGSLADLLRQRRAV